MVLVDAEVFYLPESTVNYLKLLLQFYTLHVNKKRPERT